MTAAAQTGLSCSAPLLARVLRPIPRRGHDALRTSRPWCCLRRDMSGSAPGLFICRGCRLHFMLRPACLLPAARLSPPHGLSTPRSGVRVSPPRLGPATRRSDAYRDGTCTRWRGAASSSRTCPRRSRCFRCVTTHHGAKHSRPLPAQNAPAGHVAARRSLGHAPIPSRGAHTSATATRWPTSRPSRTRASLSAGTARTRPARSGADQTLVDQGLRFVDIVQVGPRGGSAT